MSHFPHPHDPSKTPTLAETPRWRWRHLGVAVVAAAALWLGWAAWRYTHTVQRLEPASTQATP